MAALRVVEHAKPRVKAPVFVEGLPGIGHVGKLAAEHLVQQMKAKAWLTMHSPEFPPQVAVDDLGVVRLPVVRLWTVPAAGKAAPLVLMTGDAQPLTAAGQHELVEAVLDRLEPLGCRSVFTLGGFGTGSRNESADVRVAGTDKAIMARLRKAGLQPPQDDAVGAGIVGASGLFLGLAALRGWSGACLMAQTNGYLADPKGAAALVAALGRVLGRRLDASTLGRTATELDRITAQLAQHVNHAPAHDGTDHYIG